MHFVLFLCPKQGNKIEVVVVNRVCILGFFSPKQGQGFKPSVAHLHPNIGRVPPPRGLRFVLCSSCLLAQIMNLQKYLSSKKCFDVTLIMTWYSIATEKLRQDITQNHLKKFIKNVKNMTTFRRSQGDILGRRQYQDKRK